MVIGFERGLVALAGEQVIGLVGDDLIGNGDLAAYGIDGHQGAFKLFGLGKVIEKIGDGGDLVGLLRPRQDQLGVAGISNAPRLTLVLQLRKMLQKQG
jgi:hypothetical protein